ncbi:hypothetical protein [Tsukamurella tyrosinosolvens]|uniref:hypothetical protein n=1 Tax=Tsukamurella tyrosinosolvens TaxID=57704 RepID=UPI000793E665|nr:hypothetical protein [Tsukamurella tyrosinosolvens]KXP08845.1 hypothetical protein AXK59_00015 [Tsukamurella tyrosinosolvens]KZL97075.1 hypothetical protein AXX05_16560 [Tsukamurella tyrosinosolvens]
MPANRGSAPNTRFTPSVSSSDRPQQEHCDLGLIEDDNTPLLRAKALDHQLAGNGSRANDHTPKKEQITMHTTATIPAAPADLDQLVEAARDYGLSLVDRKGIYLLFGIDHELVIRTRDLHEVDVAIAEYWPRPRSVGHVTDRGVCVKVELMPAYASRPARVILSTAPDVRDEFTEIADLQLFQAGALGADLIRALSMVADPRAFGR